MFGAPLFGQPNYGELVVVLTSAITEAASAADSANAIILRAAEISESATADDTTSNIATILADVTEAATAADTPAGTATFPVSVTEAASASDESAGGTTLSSEIEEPANASDTTDGGLLQTAAISEAASADDEVDCIIAHLVDMAEAASASSVQDASVVGNVPASITEAASANHTQNATIAEGQTFHVSIRERAQATDTYSGTAPTHLFVARILFAENGGSTPVPLPESYDEIETTERTVSVNLNRLFGGYRYFLADVGTTYTGSIVPYSARVKELWFNDRLLPQNPQFPWEVSHLVKCGDNTLRIVYYGEYFWTNISLVPLLPVDAGLLTMVDVVRANDECWVPHEAGDWMLWANGAQERGPLRSDEVSFSQWTLLDHTRTHECLPAESEFRESIPEVTVSPPNPVHGQQVLVQFTSPKAASTYEAFISTTPFQFDDLPTLSQSIGSGAVTDLNQFDLTLPVDCSVEWRVRIVFDTGDEIESGIINMGTTLGDGNYTPVSGSVGAGTQCSEDTQEGTLEGECVTLYGGDDVEVFEDCVTCQRPCDYLCTRSREKPVVVFIFRGNADLVGGNNIVFALNGENIGTLNVKGLLNPTGHTHFAAIGIDPSVTDFDFEDPDITGFIRFDYNKVKHGMNLYTFHGPNTDLYSDGATVMSVVISMGKVVDGVVSCLRSYFQDPVEPVFAQAPPLDPNTQEPLVVDRIENPDYAGQCGHLQPPSGKAGVYGASCISFNLGGSVYLYDPYIPGNFVSNIAPGQPNEINHYAVRIHVPKCGSGGTNGPGVDVPPVDFYPESPETTTQNYFIYVSGSTNFAVNGTYRAEVLPDGSRTGVWNSVKSDKYGVVATGSLTEILDYENEQVLYRLTNLSNALSDAANIGTYDNVAGAGVVKVSNNKNEP